MASLLDDRTAHALGRVEAHVGHVGERETHMSDIVCTSCGYVGEPTILTKGSLGVEVILWLCFLLPGLIYSVWRRSTQHEGCPKCGHTALIPRASPMAQNFLRANNIAEPESYRPSVAAQAAGRSLGRLVGRILR